MTTMTSFRSAITLLAALALGACEKNSVQDITRPLPSARVKFFNFGVNAPQVNFYANDEKVTAITSATGSESTNGVAFGAVGNGGLYSAMAPGNYSFTGRISAIVDKDLIITTVPTSISDGRAYSMYMSGFYNTTTKQVESFIVEDNFPEVIDYSRAYVRFVNAISNAPPLTLAGRTTGSTVDLPVGVSASYRTGTAFTPVPAGTYDLFVFLPGATTSTFSRTAVGFVAGRVYTITARGDITVTSTTAANRPFLDNTLNR
jgi:hypothetical protein